MRLVWAGRVLAVVALLGLTVVTTSADEGNVSARAKLSGFQENLPKLTDAGGSFSATIKGGMLTYKLTYSGFATDVIMSHIHFGQAGVNGGVFLWLCGSANFHGPANTPTCPARSGSVSRTVSAADLQSLTIPAVAPAADQNLTAGDFAGVLRILESGDAYVNVHSMHFPGGEIRGQVKANND